MLLSFFQYRVSFAPRVRWTDALRLACLFVAGLGAASVHADDTRELRIGFSNDMPPNVIESTGRGLDVDLVLAACRRGGLRVRPFMAPMERLHFSLRMQEADGIATTNARTGLFAYYSDPYIEYHNWAVALASRNLAIRSVADLGHYSVSTFQQARHLLGPEFSAMAAANPN